MGTAVRRGAIVASPVPEVERIEVRARRNLAL
jgi:hypothetical protein